ncbi:MAG: phosphoglucomutase/phosphomannomutase family protein [Oscillospiraceae bacterium]
MIHFGTGGWRAIIADEFTRANVQLLTCAIAHKIIDEGNADKGFVIGYDRRFLSKEATEWAAEVMAAMQIQCSIIHRQSPTPLIMFEIKKCGAPYGMAVTASHNPAIYNGVKVFMEGGRDADEAFTNELEEYIAGLAGTAVPTVEFSTALADGRIRYIDPMNEYIDNILSCVDINAIRARCLSVALDPMYGVSKTALQTILLTARCEVSVIHDRHDTLFGGRLPAPNEKTLASLMTYVAENHCDIGIATDGDADRLGVIDDEAEFLHPNKILVMLYYYLMKYKGWHGAAVRNIATTHLLDKIAESFGEVCYEVPVGFKYISGKMLTTGAIIGGESSGGLTVRGHIQGKDGIYAASLLIEMIAVTGKSLSDIWRNICNEYGSFEMAELDFKFSEEKKAEIFKTLMVDKLLPSFDYAIDHVSYLDGCKVYFQNGGWAIARFSGTEPLLRIFCEMDNMEKAQKTAKALQDYLNLD